MQQANIFNSKARIIKRSRLKKLVPENLLQQELAQRIFSYLEDELQNHSTKPISVLDIGSKSDNLVRLLWQKFNIAKYIYADASHKLATRFGKHLEYIRQDLASYSNIENIKIEIAEINEEDFQPNFQLENNFEIVISMLNLGAVNNLPLFLSRVNNHLSSGGLFIACILNSGGLKQIEAIMKIAEEQILQGVSPHFHPQIDVKDGARLMQTAGFAKPFAAIEKIYIEYENLQILFNDLKELGETNNLVKQRQGLMGKEFFQQLFAYFDKLDEPINICLEMLVMVGFKNNKGII